MDYYAFNFNGRVTSMNTMGTEVSVVSGSIIRNPSCLMRRVIVLTPGDKLKRQHNGGHYLFQSVPRCKWHCSLVLILTTAFTGDNRT